MLPQKWNSFFHRFQIILAFFVNSSFKIIIFPLFICSCWLSNFKCTKGESNLCFSLKEIPNVWNLEVWKCRIWCCSLFWTRLIFPGRMGTKRLQWRETNMKTTIRKRLQFGESCTSCWYSFLNHRNSAGPWQQVPELQRGQQRFRRFHWCFECLCHFLRLHKPWRCNIFLMN